MIRKGISAGIIVIVILASLMALPGRFSAPVEASVATPTPTATEGPDRKTTLKVAFTSYEWWIIRWSDNQVLCTLWVEHEGLPKAEEIGGQCELKVYNTWAETKPCPQADNGGDVTTCPGVYLHLVGSQNAEREISVDLPPAQVWVSLSGCNPTPQRNECDSLPSLVFTGEEPLPNESIISVQGLIAGQPFSCPGTTCTVPLPPTGSQGISIEFWADSSFGDSTKHYTAQARVVPWGDFASPEGTGSDQERWYVDVLSTQWRGAPLASCSETWEAFPPLAGLPAWLTTPDRSDQLASSLSLNMLAAVLITQGEVDAGDCPNGGFQAVGVANACGLEKAREQVMVWQNRFDEEILQVSHDTGIPAQLMKNVFTRESQFWPGIYQTYKEAGLGQLTDNGADAALLWNPSFFDQFCPLVFMKDVCNRGFSRLTAEQQGMLRGALVNKVNAACPDCPSGIDLSKATFSINVFAETLRGNCEQVGQIVYNTTGEAAGQSSSYVDLWLFTLVNYNAGPGCLSSAVKAAHAKREPLDWPHVGNHLSEACQGALDYIKTITTAEAPSAALTATALAPTQATPMVIFTPAPSRTARPTQPSAPTATSAAYPAPGPTATTAGYPAPEASPTSSGYPAP